MCPASLDPATSAAAQTRRSLGAAAAAAAAALALPAQPAAALPGFKKDLTPRRKRKIDESLFRDGPEGLRWGGRRVVGERRARAMYWAASGWHLASLDTWHKFMSI